MPAPLVILGNSNPKFSGVTSTMLQTLPYLREHIPLAVLGTHHLSQDTPSLTFRELISTSRNAQHPILFHARRNDEMIQALLAKKLGAKLKIIFTSTAQRHHSKFTKTLINRMDGLITTCAGAASYLHRPADITIPHGVDLDRYRPPQDKLLAWKSLGYPGEFGLGIFGRVRPQKGTHLLVRAAIPFLQEDPKPTILIVGETTNKFLSYQRELENEIEQAGLSKRILFLGKQPFERLPQLFQGLHLVAALSDNEGFGLTPLEAMASGCAVIATQAGAWPEIIGEDKTGHLIPVNDQAALSQILQKTLSRPEQLLEQGDNGLDHVRKNYSIEREAESLLNFYQTFLPSHT